LKRGKLCRRGHDRWRKQHLDRPSGGSWICVTCRRRSGRSYYRRKTPKQREEYLRAQRLSRNKKLIAREATGGAR
jgi:hypothetical protein